MVVDHRLRLLSITRRYLRKVLEDADELDPVARGRRCERVEVAQWSNVRRFIKHYEQGRIERSSRTRRQLERIVDDGLKKRFEQGAQPPLLMRRGDHIQRARPPIE